jgi:ApaG protein
MSGQKPYDIAISVDMRFLDDQSAPAENRYAFAYTITIANHGSVGARLLSRHWIITDANGKVHEVRGDGVVGEQPWMRPGGGFEYTSGRSSKPNSARCAAATRWSPTTARSSTR